METETKKTDKWTIAGLIYVGFMFTGMAIGHLFELGKTANYLGLGLGFIAMAVVIYSYNQKRD